MQRQNLHPLPDRLLFVDLQVQFEPSPRLYSPQVHTDLLAVVSNEFEALGFVSRSEVDGRTDCILQLTATSTPNNTVRTYTLDSAPLPT